MHNLKIIAVVGLTGSGKTEAVLRFIKHGFERTGFNEPTYEEVDKLGLERNETNERVTREKMRKEFGMGVMAERSLPLVNSAIAKSKSVVVESLYSWSEYKIMKKSFGDSFGVLAVYAPPKMRYARLAIRPVRPLTEELAMSRDYAEIENVEKGGPIAMADWTIQNIGTLNVFVAEVDSLIGKVTS